MWIDPSINIIDGLRERRQRHKRRGGEGGGGRGRLQKLAAGSRMRNEWVEGRQS